HPQVGAPGVVRNGDRQGTQLVTGETRTTTGIADTDPPGHHQSVLDFSRRRRLLSPLLDQAMDDERHDQGRRRGGSDYGDHQSLKFSNMRSTPSSSCLQRASWMMACRSSLLLPETRTLSPWMAACTLSLESL